MQILGGPHHVQYGTVNAWHEEYYHDTYGWITTIETSATYGSGYGTITVLSRPFSQYSFTQGTYAYANALHGYGQSTAEEIGGLQWHEHYYTCTSGNVGPLSYDVTE